MCLFVVVKSSVLKKHFGVTTADVLARILSGVLKVAQPSRLGQSSMMRAFSSVCKWTGSFQEHARATQKLRLFNHVTDDGRHLSRLSRGISSIFHSPGRNHRFLTRLSASSGIVNVEHMPFHLSLRNMHSTSTLQLATQIENIRYESSRKLSKL